MIGLTPPLSGTFRQLGWGLVFNLLDFYIIGFDILPDFIGYIMITLALHDLSRKHASFVKAKWVAFVLIIASLPQVVQGTRINLLNLQDAPLHLNFLSMGHIMLHTLLVYWIFEGLIAVAWAHELRELRHVVAIRRAFYLVVNVGLIIFLPFLLNVDSGWATLLPVWGFLSLLAELLFLRLPFRYAQEYFSGEKV